MMRFHRLTLVLLFLAPPGLLADEADSADASAKLFRERVAPILQKHCFDCHNSGDRKGDFALQQRKQLLDSGYVEPGDPDSSHLVQVITEQDGKPPQMPKKRPPLSREEVSAIRTWIAKGAVWPNGVTIAERVVTDRDWWSLQPLSRPAPPRVEEPALQGGGEFAIRNPIDAFIAAKLAKKKLTPSPEADRRTLIRRLSYDLHGLPPTPDEVRSFLDDPSPRAYENLVERLLRSPRYGERWARHWLDVVKYADTCGYDKDKLRPNAWPYRDYVIRSFNEDKNYSQFVREQLAGDVLFPGKADGILGLGFIAAGPWDFIGHVEVPETKIDGRIARHIDRDEMVTNALNTFASTTIQCARCHNHKFDPYTQEHYYGLQALFAAVDRANRTYDTDPEVERQRAELQSRRAELLAAQMKLEAAIRKEGGGKLERLDARIAELSQKVKAKPKHPAFGYHSSIAKTPDTERWVMVDLGKVVKVSQVVLRPCHDEFNNIGAGFGFPVRFRVEACSDHRFREGVAILDDRTKEDTPNPGLTPHIVKLEALVETRYIRVLATRLAVRNNDYILALAELQVLDEAGVDRAKGAEVASLDSIEAPTRWARKNLTDGIWAEAVDPAASKALAEVQQARAELIAEIVNPERSARRKQLAAEIKSVGESLSKLPTGQMVYAAATDFKPQGGFKPTGGTPREIKVLHRGNILQPVKAATPGLLPVFADEPLADLSNLNEGQRRAELANWLTRRDHPLTWRSIVNRVWLYHFGRAIVSSPNDFGRMGQRPTHPELLDWLACEFRDGGQSFKKLHRLIVTSSTYRQSSTSRADHAKVDGGNQYLWRMSRRRLEAEEIRDAILVVSGKLDAKMYGPGFYLFKIERPEHSPHFEYHKHDPNDPISHRRSIYRFIVRSQPDPFMTTLDCADSSQSTPQRTETVTSLQALSLLNNRFNLAMAEHFAGRLETEADGTAKRVERGMRLLVGRGPTEPESAMLGDYAERHGLPNLCRVLFNLSEFVYID